MYENPIKGSESTAPDVEEFTLSIKIVKFNLFDSFVYVMSHDDEIDIFKYFFDILNTKKYSIDEAVKVCDDKYLTQINSSNRTYLRSHCIKNFLGWNKSKSDVYDSISSLLKSAMRDDKINQIIE